MVILHFGAPFPISYLIANFWELFYLAFSSATFVMWRKLVEYVPWAVHAMFWWLRKAYSDELLKIFKGSWKQLSSLLCYLQTQVRSLIPCFGSVVLVRWSLDVRYHLETEHSSNKQVLLMNLISDGTIPLQFQFLEPHWIQKFVDLWFPPWVLSATLKICILHYFLICENLPAALFCDLCLFLFDVIFYVFFALEDIWYLKLM